MNNVPATWTESDALVWSIVRPLLVSAGAAGMKVSEMLEWVAEGMKAKGSTQVVSEPTLTGYLWRFFAAGYVKRTTTVPVRYILTEAGADALDVQDLPGTAQRTGIIDMSNVKLYGDVIQGKR